VPERRDKRHDLAAPVGHGHDGSDDSQRHEAVEQGQMAFVALGVVRAALVPLHVGGDLVQDHRLDGLKQARFLGRFADDHGGGHRTGKALPQFGHALVEAEKHEQGDQTEDGVNGEVPGEEMPVDDLPGRHAKAGADEPNEQIQHGRDGDELGQMLGRTHPGADDARLHQVAVDHVAGGRDEVAGTGAPGAQL